MRPVSKHRGFTLLAVVVPLAFIPCTAFSQAGVSGIVRDQASGEPLVGVEVAIHALGRSIRTDDQGRYALTGLTSGIRLVQVRRLGYHSVNQMVRLVDGETLTHDIVIERAEVRLDSVITTAEASGIRDFDENRRLGLGRFVTRAELEAQKVRRLSDIIGQFPGVHVVTERGNRAWIARRRGPQSLQNTGACLQREGASSADCSCYMQVYVDGVLFSVREVPDINRWSPNQIEAIEVYAGPAQTPLKYSTLNSTCGVVVIHTRRTP